MPESVHSPAPDAPPGSPGEGCPTPLAWHEVLLGFREQRDEFALPTSWGDVRLWEFGQGKPIGFLGDASGDMELFALTAWLLRDHYRSLLLTIPDPPQSVGREHWLSGTADLLAQTLQARGYSRVPVYGTGWGAVAALLAAVSHPELIHGLMLQGCQPARQWNWRERLLLAWGGRTDRKLGAVPLWNRVVEANHRRWFPPFDASRWEFLRGNLADTPTRRFASRMASVNSAGLRAELADLRLPVLIVRTEGEGQRATAAQEQLAANLPLAQVEWMHSTGQFPYLTHPHRLVKLIRQFVEAGSAAP